MTIQKVVNDFKTVLPESEIYVYDNNSTDKTAEIASKAGAIVRYEHKQGKGNVIRTMFREIDADCYIMVDGDDTYEASHSKEMVKLILEDNYDMVIGDRLSSTYFEENKRLFHNTGNVLVRKMVNLIFNGNVTDIMTGFRAFSRKFVKTFPVLSKGFEIETEMTIHSLDKNLNIIAIPINYRDRPEGSVSKLNTISDGFKVIFTIFTLFKNYRPLIFFSCISLILSIISILFMVPILIEFSSTGLVPKIPTFITCCFVLLIAVQLFVCGLILDTNNNNSRKNFELQMTIMDEIYKVRNNGEDK